MPDRPRPLPPVPVNPWLAFGLQCNPFRRLTGEELTRSLLCLRDPDDYSPVSDWLIGQQQAIQFVGQEGWGKSTHLAACEHIAEAELKVPCRLDYIPLGTRRITIPPSLYCSNRRKQTEVFRIWFIDEANRLNRRVIFRLTRWAATNHVRLFLGTHSDLTDELNRAGTSVQTVQLSPASEKTIREFIDRRVAMFVRQLPGLIVTDRAIERIHRKSRGNLGQAEYILYEAGQRALAKRRTSKRTDNGIHSDRLIIDETTILDAIQLIDAKAIPLLV